MHSENDTIGDTINLNCYKIAMSPFIITMPPLVIQYSLLLELLLATAELNLGEIVILKPSSHNGSKPLACTARQCDTVLLLSILISSRRLLTIGYQRRWPSQACLLVPQSDSGNKLHKLTSKQRITTLIYL